MMKLLSIAIVISFLSLPVLAGKKGDFINAVVSQCGMTKKDAKKLATPGRQGNVVKFALCKSSAITVGSCNLKCQDKSGNVIGN